MDAMLWEKFVKIVSFSGATAVGPAGLKWPRPCLTTPPHPPPGTSWRLRPLLRNRERRPSTLEARRGFRSPAQSAPKSRMLPFQPRQVCRAGIGVVLEQPRSREIFLQLQVRLYAVYHPTHTLRTPLPTHPHTHTALCLHLP